MSLQEALQYEIKNDSAVAALTSAVRPGGLADYDDDLPWVLIELNDSTHHGHQTGDSGASEYVYRIGCVAENYGDAEILGDAVFAAINRFHGQMGDVGGGNDERVSQCIIEGMSDEVVGPIDGSEKPKFIRVMIARLFHRAA